MLRKGGIVYAQEGRQIPRSFELPIPQQERQTSGSFELPMPFRNYNDVSNPTNALTDKPNRYGSDGREIPFSEFLMNAPSKEAPSQFDILNAEDRTAALDTASLSLTGAGLFPGAGNAADLAAIPVDLLRGDLPAVGLDFLSAIPALGQGAGAAKLAGMLPLMTKGAQAAGSAKKGMSTYTKLGLGGAGLAGLGVLTKIFGGRAERAYHDYNAGMGEEVSVDPNTLPQVDPDKMAHGGIVYASNGALIQAQSQGSDTVPAMLTPGEFVMNRIATNQNRPLLESMNSGQFNSGGLVRYMASGGYVQPQRLQEGGGPNSGQQVQSAGSGGVNNVSMERPSWVDEVVSKLVEASSQVGSNISAGAKELAGAVPKEVNVKTESSLKVTGGVDINQQALGQVLRMGSQQGQNYADKKVGDIQSKLQSDTDGGLSFYA